jgi:hypothetical protein
LCLLSAILYPPMARRQATDWCFCDSLYVNQALIIPICRMHLLSRCNIKRCSEHGKSWRVLSSGV